MTIPPLRWMAFLNYSHWRALDAQAPKDTASPFVRRVLNTGRLRMTALVRTPLQDIEQAVIQVLVAPSAHATKDRDYYQKKAKATATYKAYRSDLRDFVAWAGVRFPLPATAGLVIQYLVDRADTLAPSTLAHRVAALSFVHRMLGFPDPTIDGDVKDVLAGIKRDRREGGWRADRAPALTLVQLRSLIDAMPLMPAVPGDKGYLAYLRDLRDRAFILTGIVGGFASPN